MNESFTMGSWSGQRVAVLAPTPSHPQDYGNRKRIFRVCQAISDGGGRICYIHYPAESEWRSAIPWNADRAMKNAWPEYFTVAPTRELHSNPGQTHHDMDEWWDENVGNFLKWLFSVQSFDAFIVNYAWLSKALEFAPASVLKILDTHDKLSGRRELLEANGIPPEFFFTDEEQEARALRRADIVWAIKDEERLAFSRMAETPVLTLPHIDKLAPTFPTKPDEDGYLRVGFLGARNTINRVSIETFLRDALPIFRGWFAPIKMMIAGSVCDDLRAIDSPFVELIGRVSDVQEFYASLDCVVVPMTFSTGLKIKAGEAISFGMPVVATAHAFEGYQPSHQFHSLRNFEEVANALVELSFNPDKLEELREASRVSQRKTALLATQTLSSTRELIRERQQSLIITVDSRAFLAGSVFNVVLRSIFEYLRYLADVTVVVVAGSARNLLKTRGAIEQFPRIVVADDLPEIGESRSSLIEAGAEVTPVAEFLRDKGAKVIVADALHPALNEPWCGRSVILTRPEMIAFSIGTGAFDLPGRHAERQFLLSNSPSREIAAWRTCGCISFVRAPCLYKAGALKRQFRHPEQACMILLGSPMTEAAATALAWAEAWHMRAHVVVGAGESALLPGCAPSEFSCSTPHEFSELLLKGALEEPLFVLDVSAGRLGLQLCRELLERMNVPVVSMDQLSVSEAQRGKILATDAEVAELFRGYALSSAKLDREALENARRGDYECDAGWAYVWAFCKRLEQSRDAVFS